MAANSNEFQANDGLSPERRRELYALARQMFTEEDIQGSLEALQNWNEGMGFELKDFIHEIEEALRDP